MYLLNKLRNFININPITRRLFVSVASKFMIPLLDTHQHLVYRNEANYSWTKDIPPLATEDFTVDSYLSLTKDLGIGGTLFMETGVDDPDYQKEAHFIKSLMVEGVAATRGSIVFISLGIATIINVFLLN